MFSKYSNRGNFFKKTFAKPLICFPTKIIGGSSRFTDCDAIDKEKGVAMSDPHIVLITELSPAYIIESAQNGGE